MDHCPRIAFCITCRGRADHVKRTLPQNLHDNRFYPNAVFVLLDYNSTDDLRDYIRWNHQADLLTGRLVIYSEETADVFRMAHAKNMAHRCGVLEGADILVNLDADNFTGEGFAQYLAEVYEHDPKTYLWARMIHRCNAPVCDGLGENGSGGLCVLPRYHADECSLTQRFPEEERPRTRGVTGRLVITKHAFLRTGGYDEALYNVWGPDDRDLNQRVALLGYHGQEIPARFLGAIHHSQERRFREYPHIRPDEESCYVEPLPCPTSCVRNFGHFGCGVVKRNFGCESIHLRPIPTRVFGIGLHKTGTTSLASALSILGYKTLHWDTPRQARDIWEEMARVHTSLTIERNDAACDLPISILFRDLDEAYPHSKFILTVRDEIDWIASLRHHWSLSRNPWRKSWDEDCFSHKLHTLVYGRKSFDLDTMLGRYRRHNQEVLEYFCDDPGKLLVMDVAAGWEPLCEFLHKPVPDVRYPRLNKTFRGEKPDAENDA